VTKFAKSPSRQGSIVADERASLWLLVDEQAGAASALMSGVMFTVA
jgi:hypothetical protein